MRAGSVGRDPRAGVATPGAAPDPAAPVDPAALPDPAAIGGTPAGPAEPDGSDPLQAVDPLLVRLAAMADDDEGRAALRDEIICRCIPAAHKEAVRYRRTGESMDDLTQVAVVGLIFAVDRFDPGREIPFRHFALPTISGELKRHFRDKGWGIKVSRRMQELYQEVRQTEPDLAQRLGRTPTDEDLAGDLHLSTSDIAAAREGEAMYTARSLNWPIYDDDNAAELGDLLGGPDPDIDQVTNRDALHRAIDTLPPRLATILHLRFVEELTQLQIAQRMGVSQMHVSRLISKSLTLLRQHMVTEEPVTAQAMAA